MHQGKLETEHMSTEQKKFKAGMILQQSSACNSDCIFEWEVIKRTAKQITLEQYGKQFRVKIHTDIDGNSERIYPNGKYSMCPCVDVFDCVNKEEFPEVFEVAKVEEAPETDQEAPESDESADEAPTAHNRIKTPESVQTEHSEASVKHASGLLSELLDKKADGVTKYALMGSLQLASLESRN